MFVRSEIGSGFGEPDGTPPPPRILRSTPPPPRGVSILHKKVSGFNDVLLPCLKIGNVSRNSSRYFRKRCEKNNFEPIESYVCIIDAYLRRFNRTLINPIFCDRMFGVIKTLKFLPPCLCTEVEHQDGRSIHVY